ncbi:MAG: IS110 family transposase [Nitrospira sp.]|nr:IS110 family transposase [Nitrospira sp.]
MSNGNHKAATLQKLKEHARNSIGRNFEGEEATLRLILDNWIAEMRLLNKSKKTIKAAMVELAKKTEHFEILESVPGISELTAARFIAECRDLDSFDHYKQIEKMAGSNIRLCDSGKYSGTRRISGMGNRHILKLLYLMTCNASRFTPEVRIKFLRRQIKKKSYRKNMLAASSVLLRLLMSLIKNRRKYELRELEKLELKYNPDAGIKNKTGSKKKVAEKAA